MPHVVGDSGKTARAHYGNANVAMTVFAIYNCCNAMDRGQPACRGTCSALRINDCNPLNRTTSSCHRRSERTVRMCRGHWAHIAAPLAKAGPLCANTRDFHLLGQYAEASQPVGIHPSATNRWHLEHFKDPPTRPQQARHLDGDIDNCRLRPRSGDLDTSNALVAHLGATCS